MLTAGAFLVFGRVAAIGLSGGVWADTILALIVINPSNSARKIIVDLLLIVYLVLVTDCSQVKKLPLLPASIEQALCRVIEALNCEYSRRERTLAAAIHSALGENSLLRSGTQFAATRAEDFQLKELRLCKQVQ